MQAERFVNCNFSLGKPKCSDLNPHCKDTVKIEDFGTIPYFLMIGGIILSFAMIVRIVSYATPMLAVASNDCVAVSIVLANHSPWEWKAGSMWTLLSDFIHLLVFAWGTLAVFRKFCSSPFFKFVTFCPLSILLQCVKTSLQKSHC